jgi:hypothetical protein
MQIRADTGSHTAGNLQGCNCNGLSSAQVIKHTVSFMMCLLQLASRGLRQVWNAWRSHVRRYQLLRQVLLRLQNRTAAAALRAWRARVAFKLQLDDKFVVSWQRVVQTGHCIFAFSRQSGKLLHAVSAVCWWAARW